MGIRITWPDGSINEARTATELIVHLCAEQWDPKPTFQQMKEQLSKRALAYPEGTRKFIEPSQNDLPFLRELFRVGLFDMEEEDVALVRRG
jgi:hypothetical protein